jgi:transcriptional regulator with XRE-family HTH domain
MGSRMTPVGGTLRQEREARGKTLDEVARITRIGRPTLAALERGDRAALPDKVYVKGFIRSYAECLGLDPAPLIERYLRESAVEAGTPSSDADVVRELSRVLKVRGHAPASGIPVAAIAALVLVLGGVAAVGLLRSGGSAPRERPAPREARLEPAPADHGPAAPVEEEPQLEPPAAEPVVLSDEPSPFGSSALAVVDHGVGLGVVRQRLVGRGDRFDPGDRVWFWTRVAGGASGEAIHHVWLRDGLEVGTVRLPLDGPDARAASHRTLSRGSGGRWTVEARDLAGRVLARRDFVCVGP